MLHLCFEPWFAGITCTFGECSNESLCDIDPLEVGGRTAGVRVLRCCEKFKVVVAIDVAVHEGGGSVEVAGSGSSQWGVIHRASC